MKRYLLFIISLVCAVTGVWAEDAVSTYVDGIITLTTNDDADLESVNASTPAGQNAGPLFGWSYNNATALNVVGNISQVGLTKLNDLFVQSAESWYNANKKLDLSHAILPEGTYTLLPTYDKIVTCVLPSDSEIPSSFGSALTSIVSNASTGSNTYLYTTYAVTELPSDLVVDASKTYVLTGSGALTMKEKLMAQGVDGANIDMSGFVAEASAAWDSNSNVVITTNGAANLNGITASTTAPKNNNQTNIWGSSFEGNKTLFISGELSQDGLNTIQSCLTTQNPGKHKLDLSGATISGSISSLPQEDCNLYDQNPYFTSALTPASNKD